MTDSGQSEQLPNNVEELQKECILLKKENSQLNCRLLGVNELARLLQDKSQSVDTLKDKNKRLELAVVRLENRCSNFEKKIKSQQQNAQVGEPTVPKVGTAPFIPGPSKQILESLMKENTELKKTIDGLTKKGPTSYREAVVCVIIHFQSLMVK
jgi:chromosome segregation ATPase